MKLDTLTEPQQHLEQIAAQLKEMSASDEADRDSLTLAHIDLELESIGRQIGRSVPYFSLKALTANLRGDHLNASLFSFMACMGIVGQTVLNSEDSDGNTDYAPKTSHQPWVALCVNALNFNVLVALGSAVTGLTLAKTEEDQAELKETIDKIIVAIKEKHSESEAAE